ncbi:MAG TPA: right-handed parallel beta-helix repeat-containing protein [Gaiellaceae bacterium]|nr:right-handed parallel beta-helix repeat-containing protein [Gaiellaceae bacterium]
MSYTLRGRLESRLAGALLPAAAALALAAALGKWWPVVLAGLMVAVGVALDGSVYHRLLPYQPGWAALPLGALELGGVMGLATALDVNAPLAPALGLFAAAWLTAQVVGHAALPLARRSYAEDGGELGRPGAAAVAAVLVLFACSGGVAWATQPPTVRLEAGVHRGPIVLDQAQKLVGEEGAVVQGRIVVRADHVVLRNLTIVAGEVGIDVDEADHVLIDDVTIRGATLDAIHVRRSQVTIRDCEISEPGDAWAQGIDISFSLHRPPSTVEGCRVSGGLEGIVTHSAAVRIEDNLVRETSLRGITVTEMSTGSIEDNVVQDALGVGLFCGDYSHCEIDGNTVVGTRPDAESSDLTRAGLGLVVHFGAKAAVGDNDLAGNPRPLGVFSEAELTSLRH